ncbi:hypothetical protein SAMN05216205_3572 [Pseudomonas mohnii]|uniref:Uncharacterized protein n=1 Tax=Pseudomonas mohnii TaxID=395600 RepID=A0ABY0Y4C4_9PSED|nr:hypothetical protein SAMN05216205_3572 [Pseudomonas mohnii]
MDVNDNAGDLTPRGILRFIASRLAPTGFQSIKRSGISLSLLSGANR